MAIYGCSQCRRDDHRRSKCPYALDIAIIETYLRANLELDRDPDKYVFPSGKTSIHSRDTVIDFDVPLKEYERRLAKLVNFITEGRCAYCLSDRHTAKDCLELFMRHTGLSLSKISDLSGIPIKDLVHKWGGIINPYDWGTYRKFVHSYVSGLVQCSDCGGFKHKKVTL